MTFYYRVISDQAVRIQLRFESAEGDIGEGSVMLRPGGSFYGVPFEKFLSQGSGSMDIPEEQMRKQ